MDTSSEPTFKLIKHEDIPEFLKSCYALKPPELVISESKWKYAIRCALKGKNILVVGPTGSGKSLLAKTIAKVINNSERFFYFNLGSTTDARCSLIGNTAFDKSTGTVFNESLFVKAIKTERSVILLDELSRAHPDAANILMSVLDDLQRYLRLDEKSDTETVRVASGVCFIATANVGNEYTGTRVMDRALLNRFSVKIEMTPLGRDEEFDYMKRRFNVTGDDNLRLLGNVVDISTYTRNQISLSDGKLTNFLSTRDVVEMTELIIDGFTLEEIAESTIYPNFSFEGGVESERLFMKQLVQKYLIGDFDKNELINDPIQSDPDPQF